MYISSDSIAKTENTSSAFLIQSKNDLQIIYEENETLKKQQAILLRKIAELEKAKKQLSVKLKQFEDENDNLFKELGKAKERLRRYKSSIQYEILSEEVLVVNGDSKSQPEKDAEQSCNNVSKTSALEKARRLKKKKMLEKVQEKSFMKRDPNRIWFAKRRKPKKNRVLPPSQTVEKDETEFPRVLIPKLDLDWKYSTWLLPNLTGCILATNFSETESHTTGSSGVDSSLATASVKVEKCMKTEVTNKKALPAVKVSKNEVGKKVNKDKPKVQNSKKNGILKNSSKTKQKVLSVSKNGIRKQPPLDTKKHVHFAKNEYTCTTCGKTFRSKIVFSAHLRLHMNDTLKCPKCHKSFKYKSGLEQHLYSHSDERPFVCTLCSMTFKYPHRLKEHVKNSHRQKALSAKRTCPICKNSFENVNVYKNHMRQHNKNPHASVECERAKEAQKNDKNSAKNKEKGKSSAPSASSSSDTAKESENVCNKCGKTFRHTFQLVSHRERLHNEVTVNGGDSPDYYLPLEENEESNPLTEMEYDGQKTTIVCEKPSENVLYVCFACDQICSSAYELQTHQRKHVVSAAIVLYTCTVCGKSFNCTSSLLEHQRVHNEEDMGINAAEMATDSRSVGITDESTVFPCLTYDDFLNTVEGMAEDRVVPEAEAILIDASSEIETIQRSEPEHMDAESKSAPESDEAMLVSVAENLHSMTSQCGEERMDTGSCSTLLESSENMSVLTEAYARSGIAQFENEHMDMGSSKKADGLPVLVEAYSMSVEDGTNTDTSSCCFTCSICSHSFVSEIQLKDHRETHLNVQSKKPEENDSLENISEFPFCSPLCSPNKLGATGLQSVSQEVTNFH